MKDYLRGIAAFLIMHLGLFFTMWIVGNLIDAIKITVACVAVFLSIVLALVVLFGNKK